MSQQPKPAPESDRQTAERQLAAAATVRQLASVAPVRQFVDREEPIALFQAALKAPRRTKPLVLVFHGGAGTGKSRLRRELVKLVDTRQQAADRAVITATLDFDIPVHRQPDAALLFLRNTLRDACQLRFPSFDLAYAYLWQKAHPDTAFAVPGSPNDEIRMTNEVSDLTREPGLLLSHLLDASGRLPLIGLVPKISKLVAASLDPSTTRPLDHSLSDWWERRGERELEDLPQMEPAAIVEQLPKLWASDLKDYLGATSLKPQKTGTVPQRVRRSCSEGLSPVFESGDTIPNRGDSGHVPTRRAVLFIDSYEKLSQTVDGARDTVDAGQKTDAWVRELVKQLPEALWVISGRQRLRWDEAEKEWGYALSQHELGALPERSAREFLSSCGITDEPIQDAIAKGSQGLPHYLNLAADTFEEIKQSGKRAGSVQSLFSGAESSDSPEQMFAQFIRHLDQPEIETLQVLSASRFWNYGLFEHLVTEYQTGYPLTAYDDLSRFSFVGEGAAPETRTMHDLMREALQEHQAPELRKRVHLFLHEYYAKQLEGLDVKSITDRHKAALTEAFYHGRQAKSAEELWFWFVVAHDVFDKAGQYRLLTPLYREMVQVLETELGPNHADTATALWFLAKSLERSGQYDQAEQPLRRSLAMAEGGRGPDHMHYVDSLHLLVEVLVDLGRFAEAEVLGRRMVAMLEGRPNSDAASRAQALDALAQALTLQAAKHAEAEELLRREIALCEAELEPDHDQTTKALRSLAHLLFELHRHSESLALYRRVQAAKERKFGPDHPDVVETAGDLAVCLLNLGRHAEAEPLLRRALKHSEETLGPDHVNTAVVMNNLATLLAQQDRHAEAEPMYRRALAAHEKKAGPVHPYTIRMANGLIISLANQGKYAEAEAMALGLVAGCEKEYGPDHPETARALQTAAGFFDARGRCAEAEGFERRALAISIRVFGPENPATASAMENLAVGLYNLGRYAEAEPLLRSALAVREKTTGPGSHQTFNTAINLTTVLGRLGKYAEAEPMALGLVAGCEKEYGPDHRETAFALRVVGGVFRLHGRYAEAEGFLRRSLEILTTILGPDHWETLASLAELALAQEQQGKYAEAESLNRDMLEKYTRVFGPEHPYAAAAANRLAGLCSRDGRYAEAETLYRRALAIREKVFGPDHRFTAETLDGLAKVCEQTGRAAEAQELSARAKSIREKNAETAQAQAPSSS